jgi:iron complex transport system ATP-binding protein
VTRESTTSVGEVAAALAAVAGHGDFFALPIGTPAHLSTSGSPLAWARFAELTATSDPAALRSVLDALARQLGTSVSRPVAALLHLAAAARLCAPVLATAAEFGLVPHLVEGELRYAAEPSGRVVLALAEPPAGRAGDLPALAEEIRTVTFDGPLDSLTTAINRLVPLSRHTTTGNVASSLAAAARQLGSDQPASAPAGRARELVALLLEREPLHGTGELSRPDAPPGAPYFRRRNCCLFFQIPGGGTCGDCILAPA